MESSFSPREIVSELDKFIIGQNNAKKAVAVALRNRWRRKQLDDSLKEEIVPKNILMVGPTGCGKTEISRRLAKLANAPFVKVEATKFTEVGYVGRDVEQIVRDLVEISITKTKIQMGQEVKAKAEKNAEERILKSVEIVYGLRNFIGNANKFSNENIYIAIKSDSQKTEITIEDDGPGIPKDILNKIGEPYIKTLKPKDNKKTGLGLGIFIGKTLLEKNSAKITIRNSETRGGAEVKIEWENKNLKKLV